MKKGQVSIEYVIVIAVILILTVFFANITFDTTDTTKSITKIKLRTIDIITLTDSNALLLKIENTLVDANLNLKLYLKDGSNLALSDANYSEVITSIKETTYYENINLSFEYS